MVKLTITFNLTKQQLREVRDKIHYGISVDDPLWDEIWSKIVEAIENL